uniref:Tail protein n=1 Tax=viral metagenome TaxID=1070528 RepID=A0A6M3KU08_9ZZZZ
MKNAIATAIYNILKADGTLVTALGGTAANDYKIYHVIARQDIKVPYVTYGLLTASPLGTFADPRAIDDTAWWFNVFSKTGSKDAGTIAGYLTSVLDNATLTVAGYYSMACLYDYMGSDIYDPETGIYQIPLRYRIQVDKN